MACGAQRGRHSRWKSANCDASDIRFTRKGNTLYAIALGRPEAGELTIKSLGTGTRVASGAIRGVQLLGS